MNGGGKEEKEILTCRVCFTTRCPAHNQHIQNARRNETAKPTHTHIHITTKVATTIYKHIITCTWYAGGNSLRPNSTTWIKH